MTNREQEIHRFTRFARRRIAAGEKLGDLDELFERWRSENPLGGDRAENVAAINAAIRDFQSGERGVPAGDDSSALRRELGMESE